MKIFGWYVTSHFYDYLVTVNVVLTDGSVKTLGRPIRSRLKADAEALHSIGNECVRHAVEYKDWDIDTTKKFEVTSITLLEKKLEIAINKAEE